MQDNEGSYSYELGDGDFIDYDYILISKAENDLDDIVKITAIWIG